MFKKYLILAILVGSAALNAMPANAAMQRFYADPDQDGFGTPNDYIFVDDKLMPPEGYIQWITGFDNDNCPTVYNVQQRDDDKNGIGNACDVDKETNVLRIKSVIVRPLDAQGHKHLNTRSITVKMNRNVDEIGIAIYKLPTAANPDPQIIYTESAFGPTTSALLSPTNPNPWNYHPTFEPNTEYSFFITARNYDGTLLGETASYSGTFKTASFKTK